MQLSLSFDPSPAVLEFRDRLRAALGPFPFDAGLEPIDQLVKSTISSRTQDAVSWNAYGRLKVAFPDWRDLLAAPLCGVEAILGPVTHADSKTEWVVKTLSRILELRGDFDLGFLADWPIEQAMAWLQQFEGVGPKVAAAVLNFSTLRRPVMVVDTHVWRVARRFGLVGGRADPDGVRRLILQEAPISWDAHDFYELHWLMKRLGQTFCSDGRPRCGGCPLRRQCASRLMEPQEGAAARVAA